MKDRPNILYIFTDQQCAEAMSCTGNSYLNTPAMDSLAEAGIRFENAYCTYPLCTPSRASMFTGMMPHQIGITENGMPIDEAFRDRELGHVLSNAGYECVYGGKWHVPQIAIPEGHGFRRICGFSDWDLADRCIEFINQPHDKPFFMVASYDNPHNICEASRYTTLPWGPVEQVPTEQCPNLPTNYAEPAYEPETVKTIRDSGGIYRANVFTDDDWRQYRHTYYRLVEKVDADMGRILSTLRDAELEENTLVIFSSDHGDGVGTHRLNQKSILYEEQARIPFILSFKGQTLSGLVDKEHLVSNGLDLFPTQSPSYHRRPAGGEMARSPGL